MEPEGDAKFPNVIADINADRKLVVRRPRRRLQEWQLALQRRDLLQPPDLFNQFARPLIFVPGDNEWTDCHRANNGGYDPLERLAFLRTCSSRPIRASAAHDDARAAERESAVRGLSRERPLGRATTCSSSACTSSAATTTSAGRRPPTPNTRPVMPRTSPGCASRSRRPPSDGSQGRDDRHSGQSASSWPSATQRTGFNDFLAALEAETIAFGGPVVLVHGDSHYFRIDKPMIGYAKRPAGRELHAGRDVRRERQSLAARHGRCPRARMCSSSISGSSRRI